HRVAIGNRLTADQLAALAPSDPDVIESVAGFDKPRYATGTVVRVAGPDDSATSRAHGAVRPQGLQ
ncbi:MAG: hypothetical protein K0S19_2153, partial [Geminicoccaceae bacterium]|nr:hypothetical protein [Geminicoccaceae bacterium]